jgi:hypothetical protein
LGSDNILARLLDWAGAYQGGHESSAVSPALKELGIRMDVGARHKKCLQTALGRAFKLPAFGSAGLILGILTSRVLASIAYQATPRDPLLFDRCCFSHGVHGLAGHLDSSTGRAVR